MNTDENKKSLILPPMGLLREYVGIRDSDLRCLSLHSDCTIIHNLITDTAVSENERVEAVLEILRAEYQLPHIQILNTLIRGATTGYVSLEGERVPAVSRVAV